MHIYLRINPGTEHYEALFTALLYSIGPSFESWQEDYLFYLKFSMVICYSGNFTRTPGNPCPVIMDLVCCCRISGQSGKHLAAQYSWSTLNTGRPLCLCYICGILPKWTICSLRFRR